MRLLSILTLATLLALCARPALAAPEQPSGEAKAHFDRGTALFALGRYAQAALEYERAFELRSDPALLYNAAQSHRLAEHTQRALLLYQSYLRLFGARVSNREEVERHIARLRAALETEQQAAKAPPTTPHPVDVTPSPDETRAGDSGKGAALAAAAPSSERRPLVKRPWFWVAIAGGAAVIALGIGLGVGLGTFRDPNASLGQVTWR